MPLKQMVHKVALLAVLVSGGLMPAVVWAQSVGKVEFARGAGYAQTPGQGARFLGQGLELKEGDTLSTS